MRRTVLPPIVLLALLGFSAGCSLEKMQGFHQIFALKLKEKQELSEVRQETRQSLAEERSELIQMQGEQQRHAMAIDADRRMLEQQLCQANRLAMQEKIQSQIKESVQSRIGFDVRQELEVGELCVNEDELMQLLCLRKEQRKAESYKVEGYPPSMPATQKGGCGCEDASCACSGTAAAADAPARGFCQRCLARHCRRHEPDCGGPAALAQLECQPGRERLRPAEIPLMLPVRLRFGMDNPIIEDTRIRREAMLMPGCGPTQKGFPPRDQWPLQNDGFETPYYPPAMQNNPSDVPMPSVPMPGTAQAPNPYLYR